MKFSILILGKPSVWQEKSIFSPYPFLILDKVAPAGTLRNPFWKDAVLDGLFCPLDNVRKFGIVRKMIELATIGTYKRRRTMIR